MEKFEVLVSSDNQNHHFEVLDYMHHSSDHFKFEVFKKGKFVASFEPGAHKVLHICKNTGTVEERLLHLLADQLESYNL